MLVKSALITQFSGSIGGLTGSHNRGGQYFRARTVPTNPSSPEQVVVRGATANLVNLWQSALVADQRDLWDTYALNVPFVNRLGDAKFLSGINQYVRSNVGRIQAGLARIDDAPVVFNTGDFTPVTIVPTESSQLIALAFDNTDVWATESGSILSLYISRPQNDTINYFQGPYRFAGFIEGDDTTPPTSPGSIAAPFAFIEAQKIFGYVRVSRVDARLSAKQDVQSLAFA